MRGGQFGRFWRLRRNFADHYLWGSIDLFQGLVRFLAHALASKFKAVGLIAVWVVNPKITYDAFFAHKGGGVSAEMLTLRCYTLLRLRLDKVFQGRFGQNIDSVFACAVLVVSRSLAVDYQFFGRLALELLRSVHSCWFQSCWDKLLGWVEDGAHW